MNISCRLFEWWNCCGQVSDIWDEHLCLIRKREGRGCLKGKGVLYTVYTQLTFMKGTQGRGKGVCCTQDTYDEQYWTSINSSWLGRSCLKGMGVLHTLHKTHQCWTALNRHRLLSSRKKLSKEEGGRRHEETDPTLFIGSQLTFYVVHLSPLYKVAYLPSKCHILTHFQASVVVDMEVLSLSHEAEQEWVWQILGKYFLLSWLCK